MPYYSTAEPTPGSLNSINSISTNIRDFLLNKNISSTYPQLTTAINGSPRIGQPVLDTESDFLNFFPHQQMSQDNSTIDILGSVLNGQGVGLSSKGIVPSFDVRSSIVGRVLGATGVLSDTKIGTIGAQQLALALANNAAFNVEQTLLGSLNIADNVMSLVKNGTLAGFRPSYQITIPSGTASKIGDFAGKMLGFTVPRSYLNDAGSIFQGENEGAGNIERANSMILNTGKGQVVALLDNVTSNIIFNSTTNSNGLFRSGYAPGFSDNKGVRQISETDSKVYAFDEKGLKINLLNATDGIPDLSVNRQRKVEDSGFNSPEDFFSGGSTGNGYLSSNIRNPGFSWDSGKDGTVNNRADNCEITGDKKSLLVKTQILFNSMGMKNIVSNKGDMNKVPSQIQTSVVGGGVSKGSAVMKASSFNKYGYYDGSNKTAEETYCRSWTTFDRYDKVKKQVRSGTDNRLDKGEEANGIYTANVPYRDTFGGSVGSILDKYGNPQIVPYNKDYNGSETTDPKRYMFSIENLAWSDRTDDLPLYEIGSGDLINNTKGRIMWFPPYDINFSENNSVNWETTNFIGRGEPIYTYNNTERSGTLSFKIIVDHPSYVNSFRGSQGPDDHYISSFWAGCIDPDSEWSKKLTVSEQSTVAIESLSTPMNVTVPTEKAPDTNLIVYFANDNADFAKGYETGLSGATTADTINYSVNKRGDGYGLKLYPADYTEGVHQQTGWYDNTNYGLNGTSQYSTKLNINNVEYLGWEYKTPFLEELDKYLSQNCPHCIVEVRGFASQQGVENSNSKLVKARAQKVVDELSLILFKKLALTKDEIKDRFIIIPGNIETTSGCRPGVEADIDKLPCKKDRRVEVTFKFSPDLYAKRLAKPEIVEDVRRTIKKKITDRFYNETKYFDQLTDEDPLVFDTIREKIKFFHPAFHSTTPEGLNSRLNFLLQCTRQGPTSELQGANNLAFGRAPVCILRIGDFYNTKIVMDNVGIDYEPLVWDLNPEGIGVQPMIANVNITFKFLGGSSLMGPLNKLQNALSFNYFANTQVYDTRADYISKDKPIYNVKGKDGKDLPMSAIVPDSKSGFYVNNGIIARTNTKVEVTSNEIEYLEREPDIDEIATQEKEIIGDEEKSLTSSGTTDTDKTITLDITYVGTRNYDPETANGFVHLKMATPVSLSIDYNFKLTIFDAKNTPKEIGIGVLKVGTNEQIFTFNVDLTTDNFNFSSTYKINDYQCKVEIINLKPVSGNIKI